MDTKLLKQKILDLAIRGKLVSQDSNDEPASILLEKIRKEKQELIKQGKIKKDRNESTIFVGDDKQHYEKFADGTIKNIENEIPFEIPDTWCWCRLKDLGEICSSRRILQSDWRDSGIPFYRAREIVKLSNYGFVNNELFIDSSKYDDLKSNSPFTIPITGDIMISAVGTIGKTYIVKDNDIFYYKDASVLCFKKLRILNAKFLKLLLDSPFVQKQMSEKSNGTTVDTITIDSFKYYLLCIPPLAEQQKIVEKIEELFAQVDKIEEEKQSLLNLIDKAKDKVLDLAMKGKLIKQDPNDEPASVLLEKIFEEKKKLAKEGKIKLSKDELLKPQISEDNDYYQDLPKSWVCCTLGNISSIISKGTTPRNKNSYCNKGIGFLRIENINDNFTISKKDMKYITQEVNDFELKRSILQDEDIIISIAGTLGKMAIIKKSDLPLNTNQAVSFIRLVNTKLVNTMFIIYYLQSSVVKYKLLSKAKVTAIPNLTLELLSNTCINLPPMLEQQRIVDIIKKLLNKIEQIKGSL